MSVYSSINHVCLVWDRNENHRQAGVQTEKVSGVQLATNDGAVRSVNDTRIVADLRAGYLAAWSGPRIYR